MKKNLVLLFICLFAMVDFSNAQTKTRNLQGWCGTSLEDNLNIKQRMMQNREDMKDWVQTRGAITWVPLAVHIIGSDNGGDRVREVNVFDMLCAVNEDYADQEIQFYLKDGQFNYINSTIANTAPGSFGGNFQLNANRVSTALNIYILKSIPSANPNSGNILGYYSPGSDWLVLQRDQVSAIKAETLTHELGHFFSLPHPFLGWDGEYWDATDHGNPVGVYSPGGEVNEFVNGSNCATAGDGICDTRANYGLGFGWPNCNYTGGVMDPNGELLDPQEENFMAYFLGCATEFTPDQKALIAMDLNSPARNYVNPGTTPSNGPVTGPTNLVYPIGGEVTPLFNVVELIWEPVDGATHYFVEVDRTETFASFPVSKIVSFGTSTTFVDVLDDNRTYYWRVKPFNDANLCAPISTIGEFKTGTTTGTVEIESVQSWNVSPNPLTSGNILNIEVETDKSFDSQVKVFDLAGKLIQTQSHTFGTGISNLQLDVKSISEGMYILHIASEVGVLNKKIIIAQ